MTPLYKIDDIIFYMTENKIHSAPIMSINVVETNPELTASNSEQKQVFTPFGEAGIWYATVHGVIKSNLVYTDRKSLLKSL